MQYFKQTLEAWNKKNYFHPPHPTYIRTISLFLVEVVYIKVLKCDIMKEETCY